MMNNPHIAYRTHHPHLFVQNQVDNKQNRSKIQLTHIQNANHFEDKSTYSVVTAPTHIQKSQQGYNHKERHFHSQEPVQHVHSHMYLMMKEQIDIAVYNYRQKMGQALKAQAQEIQKLSVIISYNNKIIQKQHEAIKKLTSEDHMSNTTRTRVISREDNRSTSKSPSKISLTQKKVSQKKVSPIKHQDNQNQQMGTKIDVLKSSIDEIDKKIKDYSTKNKEIFSKLSDLEKKVGNEIWKRIKNSQQILKNYVYRNQDKLVKIQKSMSCKISDQKQMIMKLGSLTESMRELKELMFNLANREFNYDSYQLNILREDLNRIHEKVNGLTDNHFKQQNKHKKGRQDHSHIEEHHHFGLTHSYSMGNNQEVYQSFQDINFQKSHSALERSKFSSLSHYAPKYGEQDMVKRSQWNFQDHTPDMSDEDEFYYEEPEGRQSDRESKLNKLQKIMRKQGYKFPVRVEIDQTGYLKEFSTGMYILDQQGNGFEPIHEELQYLKRKGVISL